ncbi:hypothetical protein AJ78_00421 [Emergomyces pasteurianus Ep9510]|uniref:C6 finger domain transcription factor nscR n=1 Tax=Emergomyces pasteurianus Ep9510 TaxID=1447872 RepID=A0A1J9QUM1_9EURO|nr:hypothetical protein AJ78_00421 [Emergomyces pasteurianus Ep9510]
MVNRQPWDSAREPASQDAKPGSIHPTSDIRPAIIYSAPTPNELHRRKSYLSSGKQITRSRVSKSCLTCRRRKVKCDTAHPICGTCEKTKSECIYSSSSLLHPSQPRRHSQDDRHGIKRRREFNDPVNLDGSSVEVLSPSYILREIQRGQDALREQYSDSQAIAARLDQLTAVVEQWVRTNGSHAPGQRQQQHGAPAYSGLVQHDEPDLPGSLSDISPDVGTSPKASLCQTGQAESSIGDDFPIPNDLETDLVDPVGSLNLGHLSLEDGGKSRYVGTTYWAYISREITELNQLLRGQSRSDDRSPSPSDCYSSLDEDDFPDSTLPNRRHGTKTSPYIRKGSLHKSVLFPIGDSPGSLDKPVQPYMLENVPTRRQSHILYKGFMSGVHAISPVVHPPSILRKYRAFWDWYEVTAKSGEPCPDPSFIPLLYAIWYGGSVTISHWTIRDEFDMKSRAALSELFHDEVNRWLRKISFPRSPSLHGLKAFLLVQTILSREEEPLASSLFVSLALRVAQTMGLHRDPAQFGISACQAEARRRIWWHIVHMDGVVAMSSGLPPLVSDENYWDVRVTSEVKDTLLDTPEAAKYDRMVNSKERKPDCPSDPNICGGSSMVNVYYLCAKGKYVMAQAIRKILKIQLGTRPVTRRDMEVLHTILIELQSELHAIVDRIPVSKSAKLVSRDGHSHHSTPSCSSSSPMESSDPSTPEAGPSCLEQYHSPVLVAFHKWARILLSLFVDKAFCVAYQPFLKNAKSKIWPVARQRALRHCHGFMEKFILLATDPDFQPFQWSWPGNHQPMHATMIMLIDLYERPQTTEAPKSRAFIDKVFSLSGPDGGVVGGEDGISTSRPLRDGGREAWDMMRRLREKAWLKAGLDPGVFWTEQAQAEAQRPINKHKLTPVPKERRGSSVQNFADGYDTPVKEPCDHNNHSICQSVKWERKQEREAGRTPGGKENRHVPDTAVQQGNSYNQPKGNDVSHYEHAIAAFPQSDILFQGSPTSQSTQMGDTTKSCWPSPSPFPCHTIKDSTPYQFTPSTTKPPEPFNISTPVTKHNTSDLSNTNPHSLPAYSSPQTLTPPGIPMPMPATSNIDLDMEHNPNPHSNHNPTFRTPSPSSIPLPVDPHNLQFDWDQWDAVFGPSLPVVDGFMHLESTNTRGIGTRIDMAADESVTIDGTVSSGGGSAGSHDETGDAFGDVGLSADNTTTCLGGLVNEGGVDLDGLWKF